MTARWRLAASGLALVLVGGVAGAGLVHLAGHDAEHDPGHDAGHGTGTVSAPASPGTADVGFSQDMVVHHEQAVEMSRAVQGRVEGDVAVLAGAIAEAQTREVGMMRGWLDLWGAAQVSPDGPMTWMEGHHAGHDDAATADGSEPPMPGMASTQDLQSLEELSGRALEVRFLQLMFAHHEGGVAMAEEGSRTAAVPAVAALARAMSLEQQQENELIVRLLGERDATPET